MSSLDLVSAILDLITTYLFVCANMLMWPMTFFVSILNAVLYYKIGLYGDMALAIGYSCSAIYGWYYWKYGGSAQNNLAITSLAWRTRITLVITAIISIELLALLLQYNTNSSVPYLDASTTVLSIIGQALVCRKIIDTWAVWFTVDVLYVYLYFHKGIPFHGFMALIYLIMAILGWYRWSQIHSNPRFGSGARQDHATA